MISGKVVTLGVAGAEVQLIALDENFAADLANTWIDPGQLGLTLVSVGRQNRLRAVIGPAERAFGPVAFVELRDQSRVPRPRFMSSCRVPQAQPHRPPGRWTFTRLTRAE